ncbi:hypothetical protein N7447_005781 [Penicillium robsamsonii]|uniref:uncharacterized protein n=1 Tax=Penicillium robsamsonii TaxID=1792511 RepID=UPI0025478E1D|nr:uncharacterized protein N7447_005781 [Penicillium robsamsonii]KAJ5823441.1 hypothetical protein N7447_005781 [Penicillium robsamsonii]
MDVGDKGVSPRLGGWGLRVLETLTCERVGRVDWLQEDVLSSWGKRLAADREKLYPREKMDMSRELQDAGACCFEMVDVG